MVNGVKSDWAPVFIGCPPRAPFLGPLLFSLYINDITEDIDSETKAFLLTDCVCYREIKNTEGHGETSGGHRPFGMLGKELGHEVPTSQMQYNADYKETDQKRSMLPIV